MSPDQDRRLVVTAEALRDLAPTVGVDAIELVWHGVDHPEGLAIDQHGVVWCGGEEGQIYRAHLREQPKQVASVPGRPLGFALDYSGDAYCCVYLDNCGVYRIGQDGDVQVVSSGTDERPVQVPNHPAFLASGRLLFTDSGDWGEASGCIYAVDVNGATSVVNTSCVEFPNGLAVSPDGKTLAVVESTLPGVSSLSIGADGSLSNRRVLVEMEGTIPDGVAWDKDGLLLISCWVPDAIYVFDGTSLTLLALDATRLALNQPTNIAFVPGTPTVVAANVGERYLSVLEHGQLGAELHRPELASRGAI